MEDQKNEEKALTVLGTSDVAPMDFGNGDSGFDEVDRDCLTIPYLRIGQSSSDYMKRGAAKWPINSDESTAFAYDGALGREAGPWRSSDHDPLLLGFDAR